MSIKEMLSDAEGSFKEQPRSNKFMVIAAAIGIFGWAVFFLFIIFWTLQPVNLPVIKEPIPILNENHSIRVGEPIRMVLVVDKPVGYNVISADRYIECVSGNLLTLTGIDPQNLPVGSYTIEVDNILLPDKILDGDKCNFLYRLTYEINPLRDEQTEFRSEVFTVYE